MAEQAEGDAANLAAKMDMILEAVNALSQQGQKSAEAIDQVQSQMDQISRRVEELESSGPSKGEEAYSEKEQLEMGGGVEEPEETSVDNSEAVHETSTHRNNNSISEQDRSRIMESNAKIRKLLWELPASAWNTLQGDLGISAVGVVKTSHAGATSRGLERHDT